MGACCCHTPHPKSKDSKQNTDHVKCANTHTLLTLLAGELGGTALAGVGAIFLAAGSGSNKGVTLEGDCVCLLSACLFLSYMAIGRRLRAWMPLFVYIFPVTLVRIFTVIGGCSNRGNKGEKVQKSQKESPSGCLLSACLFLSYMAIGRRLRSWMPLFVYIFLVTLVRSLG